MTWIDLLNLHGPGMEEQLAETNKDCLYDCTVHAEREGVSS